MQVEIKAPLSHQEAADESSATRKILRCGRRWGKDRVAFKAAIAGHGQDGDWELTIGRDEAERTIRWSGPELRGVIQGYDVVWLARDIPQARSIWEEEMVPLFSPVGTNKVRVHKSEKRIEFSQLGNLWVRSAENINSIRGLGQNISGIVINEAAFINLENALLDVIYPILVDNQGWLILMSTTNAGHDGFEDLEEGKRSPSYFNILCERYARGALGPNWEEFSGTAFDNPALSTSAVEELVGEYSGPEDVKLQQEVFAKLLTAGAGVAFPEWNPAVHIARYSPEKDASFKWSGGGDWGYAKHGWLGLFATGPERSLLRHEFYFKGLTPYDAGYRFGKQIMRFPRPEYLAIDTPAVSDGGPTILENLQKGMNAAVKNNAPVFINPPKGPGSRLTKKTKLHELLKYERDDKGVVHPWGMPQLQVHPDCVDFIRTIEKLPRDIKKPEDVDTNAEDHCYDGVTSWVMARVPFVERSRAANRHPDDHPGHTSTGGRVLPHGELEEDDIEHASWSRIPPDTWDDL